MISSNQIKLIKHIKNKYPRDITMHQLVDEFNFNLYSLNKDCKVSGLYDFDHWNISINEKYWDDESKNPWHVFVHEFGHLVHHLSYSGDFYQSYKRRNLRFSQILESEQQASLIGLNIWQWKFPNYRLDDIPYFGKEDILWLADYYKPYFEIDLHI